MSNWAYVIEGRLFKIDSWDWVKPNPKGGSLAGLLSSFVRDAFGGEKREALNKGINVIGFDGEKWITGLMALPSKLLDPNKYEDIQHFGRDLGGRPLHFLHGHISESALFPEKIPHTDTASFIAKHEKYIIPIWDEKFYDSSKKTITTFESVPTVALSEHLPEEAIAKLREAHGNGKAFAVHYDPATKEWGEVRGFAQWFEPQIAPPVSAPSAATTSTATKAASTTQETSWISRTTGMSHTKLALIGGATVLVGGIIGYMAYQHMTAKNPQQPREGAAR